MKTYFVLIVILLFCSCSREDDQNIVARVGDKTITRQELRRSFVLDPQYATRTSLRQALKSQLNYLIQQKYFYECAEDINLRDETDIRPKISYIRDQETLKAYLKLNFLDQVPVTPEDLKTGISRSSMNLYLHNFFFADEQSAEVFARRLEKEGADRLRRTAGEDLGWITFGQIDPALEDAAYPMRPGQLSPLVRSVYGYHILYLAEEQFNLDFYNLQSSVQAEQVREIIRKRRADQAIREHLTQLSAGRQIQVNNRLMDVLSAAVNESLAPPEQDPTLIVPPLRNEEIRSIRITVADIMNETLVKFGDRTMTVGEFLDRLRGMPPFHRPFLRGRNRLTQSLIDMVRSDLLTEAAKNQGIDRQNSVQQATEEQIRDFLSGEFRSRYYSAQFRLEHPQEWQIYEKTYAEVKADNPPRIHEHRLFSDVANPDSLVTAAPVPFFLKNRYMW